GEAFFGSRVEQDAETIRSSLHAATRLAMGQMLCPAFAAQTLSRVTKRKVSEHARRIEGVFERILAARSDSSGPTDLFARLLKSPGATPRSVRDQAVTFLLAGHETTSIALGWLLCLLASHPELQTRFREEGEDSEFARATVKESLRLYPSVPVLTRLVRTPLEIRDMRIGQDEQILFSPWITHRHPDFWREPNRFDPERFLSGVPAEGSYFPFGLGPRECVGKYFAAEQLLAVTVTVLERFQLSLAAGTEFRLRPQATLQPARHIELIARAL
ncbi:MAG: cytochrome P450, partial [Bdellovibrionota bacterium]